MKTLQQWLDEYAVSHQNPTNKLVHWFCVPAIFFTVVGLFYSIPVGTPGTLTEGLMAKIMVTLVTIYYFTLSKSLSVGMLLFSLYCLWLCYTIQTTFGLNLAYTSLFIFVLAWIGQFWGHNVEEKIPWVLKDLKF